MLERREEGAVEGLSTRHTALLLGVVRLEAGLEDPRWFLGGLSGCVHEDKVPLVGLEMFTTRLMPWFSEVVRVRTGLDLLGLVTEGRVLEVGSFLAEGPDLWRTSVEDVF